MCSREREAMTARAAHAAGFAPEVHHVRAGRHGDRLSRRKDLRRRRCARQYRADRRTCPRLPRPRCRSTSPAPASCSGCSMSSATMRARLRPAAAAWRTPCPAISRLQTNWSGRKCALPVIFGHNDLLPANFLDDGKRLWLIDFEYAGFSTAMFDLAGAASNAGMSADESDELLGRLFRHDAGRRHPPRARRHAMRLAAARSHVEHGLRAPPRHARRRLCRLHRTKISSGSTRRSTPIAPHTERPAA